MKIFYFQGMFVSRRGCGIGSYGAADELKEKNTTLYGVLIMCQYANELKNLKTYKLHRGVWGVDWAM
jgi:hypothetical protein